MAPTFEAPAKGEELKKKEPVAAHTATTTVTSEPETKPTVIMSELDSVIYDRIRSQPKDIDSLRLEIPRLDSSGLHRLSLPDYFEKFSYDCTRGDVCSFHKRGKEGHILNHGKYVFRWLFKEKRSIDTHLNVNGWYLVNRSGSFGSVPREFFEVSGGVEQGDAILAFMPVAKAMRIREFPSIRSQELLKGRISRSKKDSRRVLMTGNPDREDIYEPEMGSAEDKDGVTSGVAPGEIEVD